MGSAARKAFATAACCAGVSGKVRDAFSAARTARSRAAPIGGQHAICSANSASRKALNSSPRVAASSASWL
jgi:hypothetical protein